jgi:outer membrane lipopolysaccharide assembly protein LptE/RlpB
MFKRILLTALLLFLSSCGYEAIHSKKNSIIYNFSISELMFIGNRDVNLKIKEKLNNYAFDKKDKDFILKISSSTEKIVLAKNTAGDPTSFKSTILINIDVIMKKNLKSNFQIVENFNYNNNTDKFSLKRYEKEIINNLAETASEKIIYRLSNIK